MRIGARRLSALALTLSAVSAMVTGTMAASPALAGPVAAGSALGSPPRPADLDTVSQDTRRDGWDPNEPGLSPGTVSGGTFGRLFATPVDGQVYAQPLVVDNSGTAGGAPSTSVIVATENDSVYSLNGATGAPQWKTSLGTAWASAVTGCKDLVPQIGITSTPVYEPSTGLLYVVAVDTGPPTTGTPAPGNPTTTTPRFVLYALHEQTGAIAWFKVIQGSPGNDPSMTFNPAWERQRAGLLLMNDSSGHPWVYMAFGSICDYGNYAGYIAGVDTTSQAQTLWTDEAGTTSSDPEAGIWQAGGGLVSDGPGRIIFTSGNGISPPPGPGSQPPSQLGDAVIRLNVQPDGSLKAGDFFSPDNAPVLAATDRDFGSGGPIELPRGTSAYPDLIAAAGKDGRVFLLNGQSLGGRDTGPGSTDSPLSESGPFGGLWGHPAAFADSAGDEYVYYTGTGYGSSDFMRVLHLNPGSATVAPALTEVANTTVQFGYSSGSAVVTSSGGDPSTAVVWDVSTTGSDGSNGALEAFRAIPQKGTLKEIWSSPFTVTSAGRTVPVLAAKFSVAATDSGRVYVGTRGDTAGASPGYVLGYGVSPTRPFTGTQPVTFADAGVSGAASSATVTLTATQDLTIESASLSAAASPSPFAMGTPSVAGTPVTTGLAGVSLTTGQTLTIPLAFTPTVTGEVTGSLSVGTSTATGPAAASVSLAGTGTSPGLTTEPTTLKFGANGTGGNDTNFGPVPVGTSEPIQAAITNTGLTAETVTGITGPTRPFTVTGLTAGTRLQPGQSVVITGTYTPTRVAAAASPDASSIAIGYTDGTARGTMTLGLAGVSVAGKGVLTPSTTSLNFGHIRLGATASASASFTNTGNLPLTVTRFTAPGLPFGTPVPVPVKLTLSPGDAITLPVTYTPQSGGTSTGSYTLTVTDGRNPATTLTIGVGGVAAAAAQVAVPSPGGGWTLNGSAAMKGRTLDLTPVTNELAGSAVYYQPVATSGLKATFTEQSAGGTGGDGLTFGLVNPRDRTTALGGRGSLLGFGGLHGIAVVVGTRKDAGFPSANFVGITTGTSNGHLVFAATSSSVPNLRTGAHVIGVAVSGKKVTVTVDGRQYLSATVNVPATALPLFSAGTSTVNDRHAVSAVSITSSLGAIPPPGGGWSYNGVAAMTGADTRLTPARADVAGDVIYPRAVATSAVTAQFQVQIGGGTGANGMTFAFLSPSTPAGSVGAFGSGLGLQKLTGVAVVLSTYPILGTPSDNFVSIVTSGATGLTALVSRVPVGQLTSGAHTVRVTLQAGVLTVYVDGGAVLNRKVSVTPTALLAFTAGTGHLTDTHVVRNAALATSGW